MTLSLLENSVSLSASLTISGMADSLKIRNKIFGKINSAMLQRAGRELAKLYREKHGKSLPEHTELIDGKLIDVKSYTEADRALIEEAIMRATTGGSQSIEQYMRLR